MSELQDRLERLADRGTRRGADAVLQAAQRSGAPDAGAAEGDLDVIDDLPFVTAEPAHRRSRFSTLIAATGVAALVAVGTLAVTAIFGSGGAGSPEAAVRQLANAVSHKDPLAAVDVLEPTEVRTMRDTVKHVTSRAADLKIVDQASEPLAGVDLSVDNLQLTTTNLADGYAKVTITSGTISASAHRAALSKLLQQAMQNNDTTSTQGKVDLARLAANEDLPTFVMTVRRDGGWYVSPAYTALEYAREVAGGPPADFGSANAAQLGSDTPEHAVSDALRAWQAADWNRLIALAPPDELPVYDYRAWLDQEAADLHPDFTIGALTTTADVSGDHAVVHLSASGSMDNGTERWQVGGSCPTDSSTWTGVSPGSYDAIGSGSPDLCLAGDLGEAVPLSLVPVASDSQTAVQGAIPIDVVQEDGRWFVSPVSTVLGAIDHYVDHVDQRSLYPVIGLGYLLPPDGTLTVDQPLHVADAEPYGAVYAFDGQAGQRVIGEVEIGTSRFAYQSGEVYTTDGRDVGYVDFESKQSGCCAQTVTLPATGSYRLVMQDGVSRDTTLTLWDANDAPKALLNPPNVGDSGGGFIEKCTGTANSQTCTSSFSEGSSSSTSTATPTTAAVP